VLETTVDGEHSLEELEAQLIRLNVEGEVLVDE